MIRTDCPPYVLTPKQQQCIERALDLIRQGYVALKPIFEAEDAPVADSADPVVQAAAAAFDHAVTSGAMLDVMLPLPPLDDCQLIDPQTCSLCGGTVPQVYQCHWMRARERGEPTPYDSAVHE